MDKLTELLNFFGNPDLDRHRLLQGRWKAYRLDWDDPDGSTDDPLEILLTMLTEEMTSRKADDRPAIRALDALLATAMNSRANSETSTITRPFWRGFQFVSHSAATELGISFKDLSRDDLRVIIESRYEPQVP